MELSVCQKFTDAELYYHGGPAQHSYVGQGLWLTLSEGLWLPCHLRASENTPLCFYLTLLDAWQSSSVAVKCSSCANSIFPRGLAFQLFLPFPLAPVVMLNPITCAAESL